MKSEKETIYDYATELKLLAFKEELEYTLSLAAGENWSHLHFLTELLGKESVRRRECRRKSRIKSAGFPQMKYLHELVMEDMPKEAQIILPELETLDFIREGRNIVLYGNPGTGKTHIATALGIKACQQDFTVLFTSVPVLLTQKPNPQRHCGRCNYGLKNTIWLSVMNSDMSVVTRKEENCFLTTCP